MAARWGGLRPEPYDPDARDADNDGVVQEGTAWERPAGTNLLNELGEAIQRGANSSTRPSGMQVVGTDGKPVDYTPTYDRPSARMGGKPTVGGTTSPLADHGTRSLKERGVPSVREAAAPKPPAAEIAEVAAPAETLSVKERIKKKNAEVLGRIKERGGTFGRVTKKYKESRPSARNPYPVVTPEEAAKNRREAVKRDLEAFQFFLRTGKAPSKEDGFGDYEEGMFQYLPAWEQRRDAMHPDLVQHIIDTDSDDLISEMEASAVSFHEGLDQSVRVRTKLGPALLLTENKRYLTTHSDDVRSEQSQPDMRNPYEETLGITRDAEADLRPASGYLTHEAFQKEAERLFEEQNGRPPTEFDILPMTEGRADLYGGIEMILHPDVAGRTAYGRGDSLNNHSKAALMEDPTDLEIMNALLGCQSKEDNLRMVQGLAYLEASRSGDYSIVNHPQAVWHESATQILNNDYIEALVAGSFDLSEVKEVRISPEGRSGISDGPILGHANSMELRAALVDEFYSPEALRKAGMSEDEINFIEENRLVKLNGFDPIDRFPAGNRVSQVLEIRIAKDLEDRFRAAGVEKVVHLHPTGADMFDTSNYGDDASLGNTAEEIRVARARREIVADLRRTIDSMKSPRQSSGGGLYG
jgi:hypothetical protein